MIEIEADFEELTLRDYFAAKVLNGIFSNGHVGQVSREEIVKCCYEVADKMMEARKKNG